MPTRAVQSGSIQIQFPDIDTSHLLLAFGAGVLTYEIFSKTAQKITDEATARDTRVPLVLATVYVVTANAMTLPSLKWQFVGLCVIYVMMTIGTRKPKSTEESPLPPYMTDMTKLAKEGKYYLKIGYEKPEGAVEVFMNKKTIANAALIASPGIGKSTIAETIAWKIANGKYLPRSVFFNAKLIQVDVTALLAGTSLRGSLEERVKEMIDLAKKDPTIIYWIDEIHMLVGGGETIGSHVDISNMLMPVLARGDIRILGASTIDSDNRYIRPKLDLARRLPRVIMEEPDHAKCFTMLRHSYDLSTVKERIKISSQAIAAAIVFSIENRELYFPGKAIKLIEEAEATAKLALDETENEFVLTEHHIAEAYCLNSQRKNIDGLKNLYTQFIARNPNFFPGLLPIAVT